MTENPNNEEFKAKFQDVLSSDDKINASRSGKTRLKIYI